MKLAKKNNNYTEWSSKNHLVKEKFKLRKDLCDNWSVLSLDDDEETKDGEHVRMESVCVC